MKLFKNLAPLYSVVIMTFLLTAIIGDRAVTALAQTQPLPRGCVYVIDAGHGGIDGGATSCTGILESQLNLEIALRLDDMMHLLGHDTLMIRTTDKSVYTSGNTIASQKVSDIKQRVKTVNETENGFLVSIHQNTFPDGRYRGAQVFYAPDDDSREVAGELQTVLIHTINPGSNRKSKKADGIYLMEHITRPGVLIECGFLSNVEEEAKLRSSAYQKKLCAVIATTLCAHFGEGE